VSKTVLLLVPWVVREFLLLLSAVVVLVKERERAKESEVRIQQERGEEETYRQFQSHTIAIP